MEKKRICFVVQRYGLEVNGGAELLCRQLAEHLVKNGNDIEIVTTKAIDYVTWSNAYENEKEEINGVRVHRFPVEYERNQEEFDIINGQFLNNQLPEEREIDWVKSQGPYTPALIEFLVDNSDEYDVFVFFTYLYYPTVMGIQKVRQKAILVPMAHDEPFQRMGIIQEVFKAPRAFFFNTEEEMNLVHTKYNNETVPYEIGGVGIELPESVDFRHFKAKYNLDNYMIYVGRIDEGKNCNQLFQYFLEYKKRNPSDLKLVLLGKAVISVPISDDIICLGFVSDQDKFEGIKGAKMLALPSEYESLSIVVLEAMALGTPVVVNGKCPVLREHCVKSNAAFYYNNYFEFEGEINYIVSNQEKMSVLIENGMKYVDKNYNWDTIVQKFNKLVDGVFG